MAYGEKRGERLAHRNGYRELDWQTRAGTVEPRFLVTVPRVTTSFMTRQEVSEKRSACMHQGLPSWQACNRVGGG